MAGRKRAPSTPKRTPKRSRRLQAQNQDESIVLPGGALQTTFQVDGKCSLVKQSVHQLTLWSAQPPNIAQAPAAPRHVHFAQNSVSATPGGSPGPTGHHSEGEDPFVTSTPVQPSNQVSIYFINFICMYSINLIKGGFCSPLCETFNLNNLSDDSLEGGADAARVPDPGPATPSRRQRRLEKQAGKAGSRRGKSADDTVRFFKVADGKRLCTFCL
jgi:hypothetical protein